MTTGLTITWRELPAEAPWPKAAEAGDDEFVSWSSPQDEEELLGLGVAAELRGEGAARFETARAQRARIEAELVENGRPAFGVPVPRWLGGFAFEDRPRVEGQGGLPALRFVLPARLFWRTRGRVFLAEADASAPPRGLGIEALRAGFDDPDHGAQGGEAFDRGLRAIRAGDLRKLVVARRFAVALDAEADPDEVAARLVDAHPEASHYRLQRGGCAFLGASPERLVRVRGREVEADALAGSARRGRSAQEDTCLRRTLLESKKEQEEHAFVVEHVRRELGIGCVDVTSPEAPTVRAIRGIQHLHTPIRARLPEGELLDLLACLHPTPAVAGTPTAEARAWLRAHEGFERGWYTGGMGWLDSDGGGEVSVALRCALVEGRRAVLYAGAGMVAASQADAERAEARLKSDVLREALGLS